MVDLISSLVVFALILAFVTPWIRSIAERNRPRASSQPVTRGPRDLAESGGYHPAPATRKESAIRFPLAVQEEAPVPLRRSAAVPTDTVSRTGTDARSVRRALATPESLRTAILLKEIMDPPISMKEQGR
jgi:hypothetical protein